MTDGICKACGDFARIDVHTQRCADAGCKGES